MFVYFYIFNMSEIPTCHLSALNLNINTCYIEVTHYTEYVECRNCTENVKTYQRMPTPLFDYSLCQRTLLYDHDT